MAELHDFNVTDASNTARWPEGMAPSGVNDAGRADEGIIARWANDTNFSVQATVSGSVIQMTANRTSLTLTSTTSNYIADLLMAFTMGSTASPDGCYININGIGKISLRDDRGNSLSASAIPSGARALIVKDNTNNYFRLLLPSGNPQYVEGSITPVLSFGGGTTGITYTTQSGSYTKIGNRVFFEIFITLSSKGSSTGVAAIAGLPYASYNTGGPSTPLAYAQTNMSGVTVLQPLVLQSTSTINVFLGGGTNATDTEFTDTTTLLISGCYRAA